LAANYVTVVEVIFTLSEKLNIAEESSYRQYTLFLAIASEVTEKKCVEDRHIFPARSSSRAVSYLGWQKINKRGSSAT